MTSLAKIGFWLINNIGRKNKITKCYKNAVAGITGVWTLSTLLKMVCSSVQIIYLYDSTQTIATRQRQLTF